MQTLLVAVYLDNRLRLLEVEKGGGSGLQIFDMVKLFQAGQGTRKATHVL